MELSTNRLFNIITRKHRKALKKEDFISPTKSTSQPKRYSLSKNIINQKFENDENDYSDDFQGILLIHAGIKSIIYNSLDPLIKSCFSNLEYLSLVNNYIKSLNFIIHLPDLYYLDISGNPLNSIEALNYKNIFGYLKLSLERFNEKKILNIMGLYCGILEINLHDKTILTMFKNKNPDICLFNNEVNYFIEKVKYDESKTKKIKRKNSMVTKQYEIHRNIKNKRKILSNKYMNKIKKEKMEKIMNQINSKLSLEKVEIKQRSKSVKLKYDIINRYNYGFNTKLFASKKIEIKNKSLLLIKKYFAAYDDAIINICEQYNYGREKYKIPLKTRHLLQSDRYFAIEEKKLLLLYEIYKKIGVFNKNKKENKYFTNDSENMNVNKNTDNIIIHEIKNYIGSLNISTNIPLIILDTLLLYSLGILSPGMLNTIMHYDLVKYFRFFEDAEFPDLGKMGKIHFLSYYLVHYEHIKSKIIMNVSAKNQKNTKILNILEMKTLYLKSNIIFNNKINIYQTKITQENKNKEVYKQIEFLKQLNIKNETIILLTFLTDYIIYEKLEHLLINGSNPEEYLTFVKFKQILEENEYNGIDKISNIKLTDERFRKNKLDRMFNKYYFQTDRMEAIKNKKFQDSPVNNKSSIKNLKRDVYFSNDISEGNKINIDNCFVIENKKFNSNNVNNWHNDDICYFNNNNCNTNMNYNINNTANNNNNLTNNITISSNNNLNYENNQHTSDFRFLSYSESKRKTRNKIYRVIKSKNAFIPDSLHLKFPETPLTKKNFAQTKSINQISNTNLIKNSNKNLTIRQSNEACQYTQYPQIPNKTSNNFSSTKTNTNTSSLPTEENINHYYTKSKENFLQTSSNFSRSLKLSSNENCAKKGKDMLKEKFTVSGNNKNDTEETIQKQMKKIKIRNMLQENSKINAFRIYSKYNNNKNGYSEKKNKLKTSKVFRNRDIKNTLTNDNKTNFDESKNIPELHVQKYNQKEYAKILHMYVRNKNRSNEKKLYY